MSQSPGGEGDTTPTSGRPRRERAPTITIDTSAMNAGQTPIQNPPPPYETSSAEASSESVSPTHQRNVSSGSKESHESRPTSPHNVSSPTSNGLDAHKTQNFLSVPGARSRGGSLDSEEPPPSSFGGDTAVSSPNGGGQSQEPSREQTPAPVDVTEDPDALSPDPGTEADFERENNKFAFTPGQLNKMINPKSLAAFYALGGLKGIERGLRTSRNGGLSLDETSLDGTVSFDDATKAGADVTVSEPSLEADGSGNGKDNFSDRHRIFGDNRLPAKKTKSIWELAWIAYNDNVLILLTVAAIISLALGIYQSIAASDGEARIQWVEGVAIMVAIVVVVVVGAANDWRKERQFVKLNKKKEDRKVNVIRSGKTVEISVYDVLAGDILHLEPGDMVPADGIFIDGHNIKSDESSATGESDLLRKTQGDEAYRAIENHEDLRKIDPFILSGSKVSEGVGRFLVTSTGVLSSHGKTMMSLQEEGQTTPLQSKLNILAEYIAKLGLAAGLLLFVVLFIKFLAHMGDLPNAAAKGQAFLQIFIVAVTIIVVAVPEGLPLAVTLALSFATTRMLKDNNLVRLLKACETMGNATTICSDKTGTLTQNKMTVVAGMCGIGSRFRDPHAAGLVDDGEGENGNGEGLSDNVTPTDAIAKLSSQVKQLLLKSIVLNSTAFEGEEDGVPTFIGSKTETALLSFARDYLGLGSINEERSNAEIAQLVPFDSGRKCMAVVIKLSEGGYRMFVKGASEILISKCTNIVSDPNGDLTVSPISEDGRSDLDKTISTYASRSLRTIGMVYRDFEQWPPKGVATDEADRKSADFDAVFKDMTFLSVVGIQDPLRPGVTESVMQCQKAGVFVRMVTGDNIITAKAIAQACGIFTPGGVAMEGPMFRKLSAYQMNQIIPRLQVLARSSPEDKKILVSQLQKLGETVAVTGDGTNDAPALKTADVGFSMGIAGTEVAKEASDIILMDDNFNSIVKAMAWGRTVNDAVKKFLQFQVTVNITAVFLTFISAVASGDEESVLTAVQLLWVNLIMDTFAALALATDPPTATILDRRPEPRSSPLITTTMWKMIIGQSIFQLIVTLVLNFAGKNIIDFEMYDESEKIFKSMIFNTFVWMQIFNQYNARRIDNKLNITEGIFQNRWFFAVQLVIVGGQVLIIFVGGAAFSVHPLPGREWGISIILGLLSLPVAVIIRLIPDELLTALIPRFWKRKQSAPQLLVSDEDQRYEWNPAIEEIRDQLTFLKRVRGGRLRQLRYKLQHPESLLPKSRSGSTSRGETGDESRRESRGESHGNSIPQTPNSEIPAQDYSSLSPDTRSRSRNRSRSNSAFGPAAAMAGIVAGSIAGWSPVDRGPGETESMRFARTDGPHSGLDQQPGIEIHPDTREGDPIVTDYDATSKIPPSQNPDLTPVFAHAPPAPSVRPTSRGRSSTSRPSGRSARSQSSTAHINSMGSDSQV